VITQKLIVMTQPVDFTSVSEELTAFIYPVGTPQQRTNTESIAAKLTRVPTATSRRRIKYIL
jgi:hypothetical protein